MGGRRIFVQLAGGLDPRWIAALRRPLRDLTTVPLDSMMAASRWRDVTPHLLRIASGIGQED